MRDRSTLLVPRPTAGGFPFHALRRVRSAPGATFYEALWNEEIPVLLQVGRLRPVTCLAEHVERTYFERWVAEQSIRLVDQGRSILAHGSAFEPDGHRLVYWVLPWRAGFATPWRVALADQLLADGLAIARLLARAHDIGAVEPLLSEETIIRTPAVEIAGAPIAIGSAWSADSLPWRRAPEEAVSERPTALGDIYRLGQAMAAVAAANIEELPSDLESLIEALRHSNPERRVPRASEAVVCFEAIRAQGEQTATVSVGAHALDALLLRTLGDSTRCEPMQAIAAERREDFDQTIESVTMMPAMIAEPIVEAIVEVDPNPQSFPPSRLPVQAPDPTILLAKELRRATLVRLGAAGLLFGLFIALMTQMFFSGDFFLVP